MADDTAPTGTTVTAITNANGVSTPVGAGGVDIRGQYGTLHINQDGSYTYTLTKPTADTDIKRASPTPSPRMASVAAPRNWLLIWVPRLYRAV